jgi:ribosomal peptide maturation radical SAM protein 1
LQQCLDEVLQEAPKIVGFTTMFSQNAASLALATILKQSDPTVKVVFGGANCQAEMGAALFRCYPCIDAVVRGEADRVFPALVRDWLDGNRITLEAGLCYRENGRDVVVEHAQAGAVSMEEVPCPNYDEYFLRLAYHRQHDEIQSNLIIPFESARGCWWGAKSHCTFCGLNGATMDFRSKSPDRVHQEIMTLAGKHRWLKLFAMDNILDMRYVRELLPKLRDERVDIELFYETKANLKRDHLRLMREAGVRDIQPGIETFSNSILKLMRKGTTGLQNIRLLKWCAQFGIESTRRARPADRRAASMVRSARQSSNVPVVYLAPKVNSC